MRTSTRRWPSTCVNERGLDMMSLVRVLLSVLALGLAAGCTEDGDGTPSAPDAGADLNCSLERRCSGAGDASITPSGLASFNCFDDINPCCGRTGALESYHCETKTGRCAFFSGCYPPGWEWHQMPEAGIGELDAGT
jgi:hypothetical protein